MRNINEELRGFTGSDNFYKFHNLILTDGAHEMADRFQCYWFLDVIWSHQMNPRVRGQEMQVWKVIVYPDRQGKYVGEVVCEDGNDRLIVRQKMQMMSFVADGPEITEATLWVEGNTILLPSEH